MVKTLRESKAKLSELVHRASQGEEILITVRGKVKARLSQASPPQAKSTREQWVKELRAHHRRMKPLPKGAMQKTLDETREERF